MTQYLVQKVNCKHEITETTVNGYKELQQCVGHVTDGYVLKIYIANDEDCQNLEYKHLPKKLYDKSYYRCVLNMSYEQFEKYEDTYELFEYVWAYLHYLDKEEIMGFTGCDRVHPYGITKYEGSIMDRAKSFVNANRDWVCKAYQENFKMLFYIMNYLTDATLYKELHELKRDKIVLMNVKLSDYIIETAYELERRIENV